MILLSFLFHLYNLFCLDTINIMIHINLKIIEFLAPQRTLKVPGPTPLFYFFNKNSLGK